MSTEQAAVRKGRPRDGRIDEGVASTALEVLAEFGFDRFSVEEVALRAGVAKTTIYRRYPTRDDLIAGALEWLNEAWLAEPRTGSARRQLTEVLSGIRSRTPQSVTGRILMHAASDAHRDPRYGRLINERLLAPRRAVLRAIVDLGVERGEIRPGLDSEALIPVLVGPMLYLGMWSEDPSSGRTSVDAVVDMIFSGLTPASDS